MYVPCHIHLRLAVFEGPEKVGVSLPSPEDRNRSCFRNILFPSYLDYRMMGVVQKPSDSEFISVL
jgi:hypothetical protein